MAERMHLHVDRDAAAASRDRVFAGACLVVPLESAAITLRVRSAEHRLDRASFALVPARVVHALELPATGSAAVATLVIGDEVKRAAAKDHAPHLQARRFGEALGTLRCLPRTRWVDELVHRYVFEREVCEHHHSRAARFLEIELAKEAYWLGLEHAEHRTRASVVYQGDAVAARARAWIEEHLFEPFAGAQLARHCGASESTVLRAFRKELGCAPLAYVRRRRLEEAMQLLESGRYGVTEVASRVGYENASAFAVAFRQHFGVSPSRARTIPDARVTLPAHGKPPVRPRRRRD